MIATVATAIEHDTGLNEEIEGWLCLRSEKIYADLEASRRGPDEHGHRKLCCRILQRYRLENPTYTEWTGSPLGTVYITAGPAQGPDELSVAEIEIAIQLGDPDKVRAVLIELMRVKRAMNGGRLHEAP